LVNKAADCQINAMRGQHEQNKKQTDKKVTWCHVNLWRPFWCTPCRSHKVHARKWAGPYHVI
jgi:hypothetical protein